MRLTVEFESGLTTTVEMPGDGPDVCLVERYAVICRLLAGGCFNQEAVARWLPKPESQEGEGDNLYQNPSAG